jgi:hypothetical protein
MGAPKKATSRPPPPGLAIARNRFYWAFQPLFGERIHLPLVPPLRARVCIAIPSRIAPTAAVASSRTVRAGTRRPFTD